jgi:hypothetical protein
MRRIILLFFQVVILFTALNVQEYEANHDLETIGVLKSEK